MKSAANPPELGRGSFVNEPDWSRTVAIGNKLFVNEIQNKLGIKAVKRKLEEKENHWSLHEPGISCGEKTPCFAKGWKYVKK